jgi:GNAT superfamily N-acetyltransferase
MAAQPRKPQIVQAGEHDLGDLYALASATLSLDSFSRELLAEKLFWLPRPDRYQARLYAAVDGTATVGMMHAIWRPAEAKGWIGLFAVAPEWRRRGVGSALFGRVLADWRAAGIGEVEALAVPGNYFTPGLDPRYTEALCFLEHHGFERFKDCVNLLADLREPFETAAEEARLGKLGIAVRRADASDEGLLDAFFAVCFGPDWRQEADLAMRNEPPALHLALSDGRIIGFSAHSSQNREWGFFGPMGTAPEARGTGIGRVLLWHCLNDLRNAGHRTAVIPWVGPIGFYSRYVPCRVDRVFWRYRRAVTEPSMPAT